MPFWRLVGDPTVEKVVHAGQQDVEPVFRLLGRPPANLFDTQIAAGLIGLPYPLSLSKLVQELVGARLGKGLTFTSWDQRPLSGQQLRYAADDVRYLSAAREELGKRLEAAGHARYAVEESAELCNGGPYRFDPDEAYLKIRGATTLDARKLAVLRELTIWRDAAARAEDVPPRTFLKDEILLALAKSPAQSVEKLSRVRGLPRAVESEHGQAIVAATAKAFALAPGELPDLQHNDLSPREKFLCDALWASAQDFCYCRGIDPNLVTSRQEISEFRRVIRANCSDPGKSSELRLLAGWRRAALGEKLLELIHKSPA
jgi:ribonuclease D